jgi:hypothetical protein
MPALNKIQQPAYWNRISISLIALACIGAWLTNNGLWQSGCGSWGLDCLVNGILVAASICVVGLFSAIKALSHNETNYWLSWLALVVHGLFVIAVFIVFLMVQYR